jgi:hypothetical protein
LQSEREAILDAMVRALQKRGIGDATEDVLRELAEVGSSEVGATESGEASRH